MGALRSAPLLTALVAVLLAGVACTPSGGGGTTTPGGSTGGSPAPSGTSSGPSPSPAPSENPFVRFTTLGGDAFAWTEQVAGTARCTGLRLTVNGNPHRAAAIRVRGASFRATVRLGAGENRVVARCTRPGGAAQSSAPLVWRARLRPGPTARIVVRVTGGTITLDGSGSDPGQPDEAKVVRYAWTPNPAHPVTTPALESGVQRGLRLASGKPFTRASGPRLQLRAPTRDGEYYVSLTATDAKGRSDTSTTYVAVRGGVARPVDMQSEHPSWIDHAVIYAPIPDLTEEGGPEGVERQLPYFRRLGVDALWLWPPAELRQYGEEYRIMDYFRLDPQWAPESAFERLVRRAHELGMHVLVDFVPNHMASKAPYFVDQQQHGKASHYYGFFDRDRQGHVTEYSNIFGTRGLENLNYDSPEVRNMIIQAALHWIRDLGVDGFRLDAAWGVERRRPSFWSEFRAAVKRVDPDVLLLGECTAIDPYCSTHTLDVQYDWTDAPGQWAWKSVFDFTQQAGSLLAPALTNAGKGYPPRALPMRFLNNNDTDVKFVDQYGPELTRVAATLQFTVPGVPLLFAGDEIGASYSPYSVLSPIVWRDRFHLRPFYERLIALKGNLPTLASHEIGVLTPSVESVTAYVRPAFGGGPPVLVLLNFGDRTKVSVPRTAGVRSVVGGGTVEDLLTGKVLHVAASGTKLTMRMDTDSMFVLVPGRR